MRINHLGIKRCAIRSVDEALRANDFAGFYWFEQHTQQAPRAIQNKL
jgi:hypothetical protein